MPHIMPIKELKDTSAISELCHKAEEPIFITKNGYGDMVLMSMELFEARQKKWSMYSDIELSEQQIREGKTKDARKALSDIREKYGVSAVRLADIAFIFFDHDQIIVFCGQGMITVSISIIDKKEILSVKRLVDLIAIKNTDQNIFIIGSRPIGCHVRGVIRIHFMEGQIKVVKLSPKFAYC